jgi:hypothetical protein
MRYFLIAVFCLGCVDEVEESAVIGSDAEALTQYTTTTIVNAALYPSVSRSVSRYKADLLVEGFSTHVITYSPGSDLAQLIQTEKEQRGIEGVFLIGDLPAFWYEQTAFGLAEEFPTDVYLMDLYADWTDADSDGIFDAHGELLPDIYVSRLTGTATEVNTYFSKIHRYRLGAPIGDSALIFKDDNWSTYRPEYLSALDWLFIDVDVCSDVLCTTVDEYLDSLSEYAYVFQWIHSSPLLLGIYDASVLELVDIPAINEAMPTASFYNLFNCSASRFTGENLGMNYIVNTGALAVVGSTKKGGMYDADIFHQSLATMTWGRAFLEWYKLRGYQSDDYFLGMSIFGDPLLKVPR